jgi:hypothetical protein
MLELFLAYFLATSASEGGQRPPVLCPDQRPTHVQSGSVLPKSVKIQTRCGPKSCSPVVTLGGQEVYSADKVPGLCFMKDGVFDFRSEPECGDYVQSYLRVKLNEKHSDMLYFYTTQNGADVEDCYLENEPSELPEYEVFFSKNVRIMIFWADK